MHPSGSSTRASAGSPSPGPCSTSCRTSRSLYLGDTARQPYGPKPDRRDPRVRAGVPRPPRRPRRQGPRHRLQHRQRGRAARRPRALRRARRRGDPAGRAARGRRHPQRPGRRHLHPAARTSRAPTTTPSPPPRTSQVTSPAVPAVRRVRRGAASPAAPELLGVAHEYLDPVRQRGRRHPDPRLHALPAADRRHLLRHGRRRHAGLQRRGDRQGRLPGARRRRRCCGPTTCRSPTTGSSPPATPTSSSGWRAASSGPRRSQARPERGGDGVRLTVVGCSGSFAGPTRPPPPTSSRREHEGRDLQPAARPRQRRARRPAAAHRRSATSTPSCSATCTPTTASTCCGLYVTRKYQPSGPLPEQLPVYGPAAMEAQLTLAYPGLEEGALAKEFAFHDVVDQQAVTVGPFTVTAFRVNHPVETYGYRVEADGAVLAYSGDTDACACARPAVHRRRPPPGRRGLRRRPRRGRGRPPLGEPRSAGRPRRRGSAAPGAHPHPAVERPRGVPRPGCCRLARRGRARAARRDVLDLALAPNSPALGWRGDHHRHRSSGADVG